MLYSTVLITQVAGTIIGSAHFNSMEKCLEARQIVLLQPNVTATCVYKDKEKEIDPSKFFKAFENMIKSLKND